MGIFLTAVGLFLVVFAVSACVVSGRETEMEEKIRKATVRCPICDYKMKFNGMLMCPQCYRNTGMWVKLEMEETCITDAQTADRPEIRT